MNELSRIVSNAYDVTTTMQSMDMPLNQKQHFLKNREALGNIRNKISSATRRTSSSSTYSSGSSGSSGGGCYIATMAYGNYDHPQVIALREFRDNVLNKSAFGKWLIKTYYFFSPKLVELMQGKRFFNTVICFGLNILIKFLKR